jgi:hypothetical protein
MTEKSGQQTTAASALAVALAVNRNAVRPVMDR